MAVKILNLHDMSFAELLLSTGLPLRNAGRCTLPVGQMRRDLANCVQQSN